MVLNIPEEYIRATRLTEQELLVEIAVLFFQKGKLTMGQAAKLAELSQYQFQWILAGRDIPIHYDLEDYNEDLETINTLKL
jgi:predicted HTH domain antitoxin